MVSNEKIIKTGVRVWLFNPRNQILMGMRLSKQGYGMWTVPGGKPDDGETLVDAAIRETWEETGIHLTPRMLELFGKTDDVANGLHYINVHYRVKDVKMMPSVIEKGKCAGWYWFDMDKLPNNLFWPVQNLLNQKIL